MAVIDAQRSAINKAKHEADHFATEADYAALRDAALQFWDELSPQEAFNMKP